MTDNLGAWDDVRHLTETSSVWAIDAANYPVTDSLEQLRFLVGYAILAPSTHNTQPWRFVVTGDRIDLWSDPSRSLPQIDPDQRQLFMSCGAALMNLRLAIRRFGHSERVLYLPDARHPDLIASVSPDEAARPAPRDRALFDAIVRRRTNRDPFLDRPIGQDLANEIMKEAADQQAWMVRLESHDKLTVAYAIAEADRRRFADATYRDELSHWLVPRGSDRRDGIPMVKKDVATALPLVAPIAVRHLDRGGVIASHEAALTTHAPMLAVLGTELDEPLAWLWAGQALEAVFLRATSHDVAMSFLNQVVEDAEMRDVIADASNHSGVPQLVLRFGYGPPQLATPRRPLADVLSPVT